MLTQGWCLQLYRLKFGWAIFNVAAVVAATVAAVVAATVVLMLMAEEQIYNNFTL